MSMNEKQQPTYEQLAAFTLQLLEHLEYCGWGDSWERECAHELRQRARIVEPILKAQLGQVKS